MDRTTFTNALTNLTGAGMFGTKEINESVWYMKLKDFPNHVLSRAVNHLIENATRFPSLGEVYQQCRALNSSTTSLKLKKANPNCQICEGSGFVDVLSAEHSRGMSVAYCPCVLGVYLGGTVNMLEVIIGAYRTRRVIATPEVSKLIADGEGRYKATSFSVKGV